MFKSGLDDHVCPSAHGGESCVEGARISPVYLDDIPSGLSEPLYVRLLVLPPPLPKDIEHRIVEKRAFCEVMGRQPL